MAPSPFNKIIEVFQMLKEKKAQMKIQEMAFVLVAVIFLGGILLLFFARFQMGAMQQSSEELREMRTVTLLRVVASIPELSCAGESVCIDEDKLRAFDSTPTIQSSYSRLWSSSNIAKIIVEEVYPKTNIKYKVYEKATSENTVTYSTYVPLCSEAQQESICKIAKIKITTITE